MKRRSPLVPASHDAEVEGHAGYVELIRSNANFRRLWSGNVVSLLGDWFNTIAIYTLVTELTGSPFALGAVFIAKMLPWAIASPIAGLIVDRFNRRRLMIGSDLLRAVIVLGFLLVDHPSQVYLVYILTALQVVVGSVFQPAKAASIPNVTTPCELLTANALSSATWSVMLALGAALGGVATELVGIDAVFVIDSGTYLISAWFIHRTAIPQRTEPRREGPLIRSAVDDILEGWQHLRENPRVGRIATAKATWGVAGGALVYLLTLLGEEISPQATAMGIGVLFAVRGAGTGLGPILVRAIFVDRSRWPLIAGSSIALSGVCYALLGIGPWTYAIVVWVLLAHAASGANWVLATVMLQKRTEDRFRGRVFATEWLLVMGAEAFSIFIASTALEAGILDLRSTIVLLGGAQIISGLLWLGLVVPAERKETH